jgi:hypothetical protein
MVEFDEDEFSESVGAIWAKDGFVRICFGLRAAFEEAVKLVANEELIDNRTVIFYGLAMRLENGKARIEVLTGDR